MGPMLFSDTPTALANLVVALAFEMVHADDAGLAVGQLLHQSLDFLPVADPLLRLRSASMGSRVGWRAAPCRRGDDEFRCIIRLTTMRRVTTVR